MIDVKFGLIGLDYMWGIKKDLTSLLFWLNSLSLNSIKDNSTFVITYNITNNYLLLLPTTKNPIPQNLDKKPIKLLLDRSSTQPPPAYTAISALLQYSFTVVTDPARTWGGEQLLCPAQGLVLSDRVLYVYGCVFWSWKYCILWYFFIHFLVDKGFYLH